MAFSLSLLQSSSLLHSPTYFVVLATVSFPMCANDEVSPIREKEHGKPSSPHTEASGIGGSLVYSEEEIAILFAKIEKERKDRESDSNDNSEDTELEVYTLRAIEVSPLDLELYERLDFALRSDSTDSSLKESKIDKRIRLEKLYAERADQRFWSGEYDGTYDPDVPEVGSIDLSKLFDGMTNLLGKKKNKKIDLSER